MKRTTQFSRRWCARTTAILAAACGFAGVAQGQIQEFIVDPPSTSRFYIKAKGDADSSDVQARLQLTPWNVYALIEVKAAGWFGTDFVDFTLRAHFHSEGPHETDEPDNPLGGWPGRVQIHGTNGLVRAMFVRTDSEDFVHDAGHRDLIIYTVSAETVDDDPSELQNWKMSFEGHHPDCLSIAQLRAGKADYADGQIDFTGTAAVAADGSCSHFFVRIEGYTAEQITGGSIRNTSGSFVLDLGSGSQWTVNSPTSTYRLVSGQSVPASLAAELAAGQLFIRVQTSDPARPVIEVPLSLLVESCAADFDGSGSASVQDIFSYLEAYFMGFPTADFNGAGGISVQDIFDFLAAFFEGCN